MRRSSYLYRIIRDIHITQDIFVTNFLYSFPYALKWFYRRYIRQQIFSYFIGENTNRTSCYLYSHSFRNLESKRGAGTLAVLILHGKFGSPLSVLHLAEIAEEMPQPVFSLHLSYDGNSPDTHRGLLSKAISKIEEQIKENGSYLKGLVMVGHSLGGTEAAYRAFVTRDERIKSVISIAARLRVIPSAEMGCPEFLKSNVESIYEGIQKHSEPSLYQIAAEKDWNAPIEATVVRLEQGSFYIVEKAQHFNVLYDQETREKFREFLIKTISS